jgi:uncharacterized membrane protein YjjB (DUF3815 family)
MNPLSTPKSCRSVAESHERKIIMRRLLPALLFLLPGVLGAQAASYTYINQKAPYKNPSWPSGPWLTALNLPKIGTTFKVQVPASMASTFYFTLAFGVRNPNTPIGGFSRGWGYLYSSAEILVSTPRASTAMVTLSFAIPNSSQLLGARFYQQVVGDYWLSNSNIWTTLSRGGVGVIGK